MMSQSSTLTTTLRELPIFNLLILITFFYYDVDNFLSDITSDILTFGELKSNLEKRNFL